MAKRSLSAAELMEYKTAYGSKMTPKDYFMWVGIPATISGGLTGALIVPVEFTEAGNMVIFPWCLPALAMFTIGALFGYFDLLPKAVIREYETAALNERNRLLKVLTQAAVDESAIAAKIIQRGNTRIQGELHAEFELLETNLVLGRFTDVPNIFTQMRHKYGEKDIVFGQYLEQLETRFMSGNPNVKALKEMEHFHTTSMRTREKFLKGKDMHMSDFKTLVGMQFMVIGMMGFSFKAQYIPAFSHNIVGYITASIYLMIVLGLFKKFITMYFDDDIQNVRSSKQKGFNPKTATITKVEDELSEKVTLMKQRDMARQKKLYEAERINEGVLDKFSWSAWMFAIPWGIVHQAPAFIGMGMIPIANIFLVGRRARRALWETGRYNDIDHFVVEQDRWDRLSRLIFIILVVIVIGTLGAKFAL